MEKEETEIESRGQEAERNEEENVIRKKIKDGNGIEVVACRRLGCPVQRGF